MNLAMQSYLKRLVEGKMTGLLRQPKISLLHPLKVMLSSSVDTGHIGLLNCKCKFLKMKYNKETGLQSHQPHFKGQ